MKRKTKNGIFNRLKYRCPPVTLYLDDINLVVQIIQDSGAKYSMGDSEFDYDSLDEVRENRGDKVKGLTIYARYDGQYDALTVEFERGAIFLKAAKTEKLIVLWHQIRDVLDGITPWYLKLLCWPPLPYLALFLSYVISRTNELTKPVPGQARWVAVITLLLAIVSLVSILMSLVNPAILFKKRHDVEGFLRRNAEKVFVGIIGSVFGIVLKIVFDKLIA